MVDLLVSKLCVILYTCKDGQFIFVVLIDFMLYVMSDWEYMPDLELSACMQQFVFCFSSFPEFDWYDATHSPVRQLGSN